MEIRLIILTLEDENGRQSSFQLLDTKVTNEGTYYLLLPLNERGAAGLPVLRLLEKDTSIERLVPVKGASTVQEVIEEYNRLTGADFRMPRAEEDEDPGGREGDTDL